MKIIIDLLKNLSKNHAFIKTREDLAKELNISKELLNDIIKNRRQISIQVAYQLEVKFHISMEQLLIKQLKSKIKKYKYEKLDRRKER